MSGDDTVMERARLLARHIASRRWQLDQEVETAAAIRRRGGHASRGHHQIELDRARTVGMADALAYLLGKPGDRAAAEKFITETVPAAPGSSASPR